MIDFISSSSRIIVIDIISIIIIVIVTIGSWRLPLSTLPPSWIRNLYTRGEKNMKKGQNYDRCILSHVMYIQDISDRANGETCGNSWNGMPSV